jgi:phospholipid/cholesterol/gamma-HCH transport system substrate-binding protein
MARKVVNHFKLGIFVLAGLAFLILLLYMIGKNQNLFGSTFVIKARFANVHGLVPGSNVRFGGITAGTVESVNVMNDSTIEVEMNIQTKMHPFIRKNAKVSIGTDGLMGNKLVNIISGRGNYPVVEEGDLLGVEGAVDTDEMFTVLNKTNNDVAEIAAGLKVTIQRINNSTALWKLLNDESLPANVRASVANARMATQGVNTMVVDLQSLVADVKKGKGSLGTLLTDTAFAQNLNQAVDKIKHVGDLADTLSVNITALVTNINNEVANGKGPANALLKDEGMVAKMNASLTNIEKGTAAFNDNMEALKSNFLFRGYFRRQEAKKKKEASGGN